MAQSVPLDWWRRETAASDAPIPARAGAEPKEGQTAFWALVAFTAILFAEPQRYLPILETIRINFLVGAIAVGAYLAGISKPVPLRFPREAQLAVALAALALLSVPGSYWPGSSFEVFTGFLKVLSIFWLVGQVTCSVGRLRAFAWVLVLLCLPIAFTAVKDFAAGTVNRGGRIDGFGRILAANPNDLALLLNLFMPFAIGLAVTTRRMAVRVFLYGCAALGVAAVLATFSRGGFLTLGIEAALGFWLVARRRPAQAFALVLLIGGVTAALAPEGYYDRIATISSVDSDPTGSSQQRWSDTKTAVGLMVQNPIRGAGIGQGILALNEARGAIWSEVHNAYLNYGVDLGLVGLAIFCWLMVVTWRSARGIETLQEGVVPAELLAFATCIRISLTGFAVAAIFHPVGYDFYFFYLAGFAVALKTAAARQFGVRVSA